MPISPSDRAFLKQLYANLADEALKPESPFYEPVYQKLGLDDPVQQISTLIEFDGVESIRLSPGSEVRERLRSCSASSVCLRSAVTSSFMRTR